IEMSFVERQDVMDTVEELLSKLYHEQVDTRDLLDLVPLLFEAADQNDEEARCLVVRMGTEVAVTANAIIRRLSLVHEDVEVVLGGSVFKGKGDLMLNTITRLVHEEAPKALIVMPRHEPVVGAVLLALEQIGVTIDEAHNQLLGHTFQSVNKSRIW
ncbi:MAG: BadF/BadG/BcrA/BcrD ATPase family protein, partial [bacterium]